MVRYALIDGDEVVNVVEWDGQEPFPPTDRLEAVELPPDAPAEPGGRRRRDPAGWDRAPTPAPDPRFPPQRGTDEETP